ncbi:organic cation transporter protein-like [Oratosquilla oratoria]|uniref:organic cation transporter protein-like n=1 Tax=Oratosquilla oratoria TaxID=337810 RepID=UPI003F770231
MAEHQDNLDNLLDLVGTGPWSALFFATSSIVPAIIPSNLVGGEFLNPVPSFWCLTDDNNSSVMIESACSYWDEEEQQSTACSRFLYNQSVFHSTVAMEWDLICDQEQLQVLFQVLYTVGSLIGSILGGMLASRYGRRWAVRLGALVTVVLSVLLAVSPWYSLVLVIRVLLGVFVNIMVYPAFLLSIEVCVPRLRPIVGMMLALPYAITLILLSATAFFVRHWRNLQLISSIPALLVLPFLLYVDESPRWLLSRGRVVEAADVLHRGARLNGSSLPDHIEHLLDQLYQKQQENTRRTVDEGKDTLLSLVTMPTLRLRTLVLLGVWFLLSIVYLGIPLNADQIGSPFLYMGLVGVMEIPAYSLTAPITRSFGRRKVAFISMVGSGLCAFAVFLLNWTGAANGQSWSQWVFVLVGYMLTCTSYQVIFLYSPELFPTSLRPQGTAICVVIGNVGFSIPPYISMLLGEQNNFYLTAILGVCSLSAGLLLFLLPETNGCRLPETVAEVEEERRIKANTTKVDSERKTSSDMSINVEDAKSIFTIPISPKG